MSETDYTIRLGRIDELAMLQEIERAAGELFARIGLDRVAEDEPLPLDFLLEQQLSTFSDVTWNAPYYARIGFRVLEEGELSEGLSTLLGQEKQAWFPLARVCMGRDLSNQIA